MSRPLWLRFWDKVKKTDGCWEWTGWTRESYGRIKTGGGAFQTAHRVSWELHNGAIPPGLFVLHKCDNPKCVRPDHLFMGTKADNNHDRHSKGRSGSHIGEKNGRHILSEADVLEIRRRFSPWKCKYKDLAKEFNVSMSTINYILAGRTWKHLIVDKTDCTP